MRLRYIRNSQGVALLAALFVLMVLSILGIGLLTNVDDEIRMSQSTENSEMALKVAEAGIQVARTTFVEPAIAQVTQTEEFSSIDGFYRGGYFLVQMESGFQGDEKWVQWRYDEGVTGNNTISEISTPVFHVWRTGAGGVNGSWSGTAWSGFSVSPIYGIVARGTYFPIQTSMGGVTVIRAHDEYTGAQKVDVDDDDFATTFSTDHYWIDDKTLTNTATTQSDIGYPVKYAVDMSPMVSFSNYSTRTGKIEPVLSQQTLYFVYTGNSNNPPDGSGTTTDRTSTVRLRAVNALCHGGATGATNYAGNNAPLKSLWEFDTGMHGTGTAPAFVDPSPDTPGDEILYFAVIARGEPGTPGALDFKAVANDVRTARAFPSLVTEDPEQIYLFAVVDTTGKPNNCTSTGTYKVKWARPFPDPDVMEWTDYPTEHLTGTDGTDPPYVHRPSDMVYSLPEGDLLPDYRDGPMGDDQWNHMRGNIFEAEAAVSPPVIKILYRDGSGNLTENPALAASTSRFDPIIDIYLMYAAFSRVTYLRGSWRIPLFSGIVQGLHGADWGPPGYRKANTVQVRVLALRDHLVSIESGGTHTGWNWTAAKSRYPTFKWTYRVPGWDPDQTHANPDDRPWNGYGEYVWDTYFPGQISPMINTLAWNEDDTAWNSVTDLTGAFTQTGGAENLYNVIYPYYKSTGFVTGSAYNNNLGTGRDGPNNTTQGSVLNFSGDSWTDARVMLMAIRDTWDDYMVNNRTNILGSNNANPALSNPVEPYWTHRDNNADPNTSLITYNSTLNAQYNAADTSAGISKVGFPRPYTWWEALWTANVRAAASGEEYSLYRQGWENVIGTGSVDTSMDVDIEGETAAMCTGCLQSHGLIVLPFNHDLDLNDNDASDNDEREDLRIHAIDATTGIHQWDYHMAASLKGDDANNTPAIANNLVFVAYQQHGDKGVAANRRTLLTILDADDGTARQRGFAVDRYSDAVILPPTIANGAVYVGTYSFQGTYGPNATGDDIIRLFAMSPVIRLVSTGVYPFDYPGAEYPYGYKHYTGGAYPFAKITSLDHDKIFKNPTGEVREIWKRKLQVWVTGQNSKWEEVREVLE